MRWLIKQLHTSAPLGMCLRIHERDEYMERIYEKSLAPSLFRALIICERKRYAIWAWGIFIACKIRNKWMCVYWWASKRVSKAKNFRITSTNMIWKNKDEIKAMKWKATVATRAISMIGCSSNQLKFRRISKKFRILLKIQATICVC